MPNKRLDRLFQACHRDVERFLERRVPSPEIAADLMQEAFLRLARAEPATLMRDAKAYLFRTADNLVTDYYRSQARDPIVRADDASMHLLPDPAPAPDAVVEAREELGVLRHAINDLPPRGREVFVLHKFEGLRRRGQISASIWRWRYGPYRGSCWPIGRSAWRWRG